MADVNSTMKTHDTTPGSPRRAALKATRPAPKTGNPGPTVYLTEDALLRMTSAEVYNALSFAPTVHYNDQDHSDTDVALNRAVRALVEAEMDFNPEVA